MLESPRRKEAMGFLGIAHDEAITQSLSEEVQPTPLNRLSEEQKASI